MKLERAHESVLPTVVIAVGLLLAVYLGLQISSGAIGSVMMVLGVIGTTAVLLVARERIWVLIPATWMLNGKVSALPLPFSVAHLTIFLALATFMLLKAFKIVRMKPKSGMVEFWMLVVVVYLVTVYLRNPVGVDALGSERVGGKPYFDVAVACAGFWVLARSVATPLLANITPFLVVAGYGFTSVLNLVANSMPSIVGPLSRIYSGFDAAALQDGETPYVDQDTRRPYLEGFGSHLFLTSCAFWRPLTLLNPFNLLRFSLLLASTAAVLFSGFRSAVMNLAVVFTMSTYFRRGMGDVIRFVSIGLLFFGFLIGLQGTILSLPIPVQRSLSFLPGKWDYAAKSDAEGSTEWRVVMWKGMLTGNKYIENKWLGDGFGFTKRQLQIMAANSQTGSTADHQENLMISGGVHSGPISAIRYAGYVGLFLFIILLILIGMRAVRLIRRSEGTPYYALALFLGMPAIWHPIKYIFIFGGYENDLPYAIIAAGMQVMLQNSLDAHEKDRKLDPKQVQPISNPRRIDRPVSPVPQLHRRPPTMTKSASDQKER